MPETAFLELASLSYIVAGAVVCLLATIVSLRKSPLRLVIRCILIGLIALAGLQPAFVHRRDIDRSVVLIDVSDSMPSDATEILMQRAKSLAPGAPVIYFSAGSAAALPGETGLTTAALQHARRSLATGETDLGQAFEQALLQGPANILVISDAQETKGDLRALIDQGAFAQTPVFPLTPPHQPEKAASITEVRAPLLAPQGSQFQIIAAAQLGASASAGFRFRLTTPQGKQIDKPIPDASARGGSVEFSIEKDGDGIEEFSLSLLDSDMNRVGSNRHVYVASKSRAKVLLLSGSTEDDQTLADALTMQSFTLDRRRGSLDPSALPSLTDQQVIILQNIPADELSDDFQQAVRDFVVTKGGALIMIGGNKSFGLGHFKGTPIESVLPVSLTPPRKDEKRLHVAVQLVIDKSRSMSFQSRLQFAKEASREVVRNLKDEDFVGVIGFDTTPFVVFPIKQVGGNRDHALNRIGTLFSTGRTNLYPALEEARRGLMQIQAGRKHIIVVTDGKLPDEGPHYFELISRLRLNNITLSTVMLGGEAGIEFLREMADRGGGSFYHSPSAETLPRIFLQDVKIASGEQTLQEAKEFYVQRAPGDLSLVSLSTFPPLLGFVQTEPRSGADLELLVGNNRGYFPLLARQAFGKGIGVAFTSDANGRWSRNWVRWPGFSNFWRELIENVLPKEEGKELQDFQLSHALHGNVLALELHVFQREAESVQFSVDITTPDGTDTHAAFERTNTPGIFRASLPARSAGKYVVKLLSDEYRVPQLAFEVPPDLFGESSSLGWNRALLHMLAERSDGAINPTPDELRSTRAVEKYFTPLAPWLLLLAVFFLIIEIALREGSLRSPLTQKRRTIKVR